MTDYLALAERLKFHKNCSAMCADLAVAIDESDVALREAHENFHRLSMAYAKECKKVERLIVAKECAERGCCAHDPRVDGGGVEFYPTAEVERLRVLLREAREGVTLIGCSPEGYDSLMKYQEKLLARIDAALGDRHD